MLATSTDPRYTPHTATPTTPGRGEDRDTDHASVRDRLVSEQSEQLIVPEIITARRCAQCGFDLTATARYCRFCGSPADGRPPEVWRSVSILDVISLVMIAVGTFVLVVLVAGAWPTTLPWQPPAIATASPLKSAAITAGSIFVIGCLYLFIRWVQGRKKRS
jgi:hypothetical protein